MTDAWSTALVELGDAVSLVALCSAPIGAAEDQMR